MSQLVYVNEKDLEADVCTSTVVLRRPPSNWSAGIQWQRNSVQIVGSMAGASAQKATAQPRDIDIDLHIKATTAAIRDSDVALMLSLFKQDDLLELRVGDNTEKVCEGFLLDHSLTVQDPSTAFQSFHAYLSLRVRCLNPSKRDRYVRAIGFGSARTAIPLGTLASYGKIYIMGSASDPTITYRDAGGNVVQTMAFTVTLGATEYLEIDTDVLKKTIKKYTAGVAGTLEAGAALRTGGTPAAGWIVVDERHGSYPLSLWPTLEVSSGAGLYVYHRRWDN